MIENLLRDTRYAVRSLRRSPGFFVTAVLTLGLAIGANSAIFAVVRALLLQPLPYADADRLVILGEQWPNLTGPRPVSMLNYVDWTQQSTVFEKIAAVSWGSVTVNDGPQPIFVKVRSSHRRISKSSDWVLRSGARSRRKTMTRAGREWSC